VPKGYELPRPDSFFSERRAQGLDVVGSEERPDLLPTIVNAVEAAGELLGQADARISQHVALKGFAVTGLVSCFLPDNRGLRTGTMGREAIRPGS